jgi:CBS domain-containing protein
MRARGRWRVGHADFSDRNPFHHLTNKETLYDAIDAMAVRTYVRRSLVFADDAATFSPQMLQSIVSQTAIITFLSKHAAQLGPIIHAPIDQAIPMDWAAAKDKVVSISGTDTLNHAFQLMFTQNVSGLAVLDDKATLMGTISIRDLKYMLVRDKLDVSWLKASVREYMNHVRAQSDMERHPAISLRRTDSFGTLIAKIASTAVHRIFIIDENNAPIGVVGTIDVLRALMAHTQ